MLFIEQKLNANNFVCVKISTHRAALNLKCEVFRLPECERVAVEDRGPNS